MVSARLPVVTALGTVARQSTDTRLQEALSAVAARVRGGESLADAFARRERDLGALATSLVRVGEASGTLDAVLLRLADALERSAALRRQIRLALLYPAVVLVVAAGAVAFLLAVVVPTFADLFADFDAELPWQTQALVSLSEGLRGGLWWIAILVVAGVVLARRALRSEKGRAHGERVLLRVPVAGSLYRKALTASFCRTLATLLGGSVPLADALGVTAEATTSPMARDAARTLRRRVVGGGSLADRLNVAGGETLFPPMVADLVEVGEETARLDEMLAHAASHYEREVDGAVDALASVIEPVLVVALGLVVGAILVAIYLPMFDLVTTIE